MHNNMKLKDKNEKGFGLLEAVIGISIALIILLSIGQITVLSIKASEEKTQRIKALNLAKEGIEIVRVIRDDGWTSNIASLSFGTSYYIATSSNQWILTQVNPGLIEGKFTRTIVVDNVSRDSNDDIVISGGVNDAGTKKVTSSVAWGGSKNIQLVTYITNILDD